MCYKKQPVNLFTILLFSIMLLVILVCIVPFIYMIALSFSDPSAIMNNQVGFFPVGFTIASYKQILTYPNFFKAYGNTLFYTFFGTLIALCCTAVFAYPLSKKFLRGAGTIMKLIVFSMFFSGGLIPTYLLVSSLHLTGTVFAILIPFAVNQFHLIILINFFKAFPQELEEAAFIDGLGYFRIFVTIVLPLSTPALATIGLYTAVFFWNDWFNGLIYLKSSQFPVMLFLRNIVNGTLTLGDGAGRADMSVIGISIKAAVIIISSLPIILLYPFLQKYFVKGLTIGSVKG
mgnify:CR=1 FL=1